MQRGHWPFFDLRVVTPRIELRYPDDELLHDLVEVAAAGVHPPDEMPFSVPWTDARSPVLERTTLQYWWGVRASLRADDWHLPLVVLEDGAVCGVQSLMATEFPVLREVSSGSWLGLAWHGRGIGTEMRAAALHLAFEGLGASRARSAAFADNVASVRVSQRLGYAENGTQMVVRRGAAAPQVRFLLERSAWTRRDDVTIHGLDACLSVLGLA